LKNLFFILSTGRTGTKFLAQLLDNDPNAKVFHEPYKRDFGAYVHAYYSEELAMAYIRDFRAKLILDIDVNIYGEVNGVLRRHVKALQSFFPEAKIFHLVRDGRDVIRSMFSRSIMTKNNIVSKRIHPKENDSFYGAWPEMNRFEKICWFWNIENKFLRENTRDSIQLEKILFDYSYFKSELLEKLELNVPHNVWNNAIKTKINFTKKYKIPHWKQWSLKQLEVFDKIAAKENRLNGY